MENKENITEEVIEEVPVADEASAEETKEVKKDKKSECKKHKAEIEKLKAEVEAEKAKTLAAEDKYLRCAAEYENFRRRSQKEREGIYADAQADTVENILPIGDNLARAAQFTDPASVAKGISMMQKSFDEALGKMGIVEIEALGKEFDPVWHNAVLHVEDDTVGENTVVEVLQKGYRKGDHVVRYAMVKVAN